MIVQYKEEDVEKKWLHTHRHTDRQTDRQTNMQNTDLASKLYWAG